MDQKPNLKALTKAEKEAAFRQASLQALALGGINIILALFDQQNLLSDQQNLTESLRPIIPMSLFWVCIGTILNAAILFGRKNDFPGL